MQPDVYTVVPHLQFAEALRCVGFCGVALVLPGWVALRLFGLRVANQAERWTLIAVLGALWSSWTYFALVLCGQRHWHWALLLLPILGLARRRWGPIHFPRRRNWTCPLFLGWGLIGLFVLLYLARTTAGVQFDEQGLRLYGAWFSDKMTGMSPCAACLHEVPPQSLRFAGHCIPQHYFPHLFVAALDRAAGVDYVRGFWFYGSALGIVLNGLAVLAFARRLLRSRWLACVALLFWGLIRFDAEIKPFDLSLPLLLLALLAIDRWSCSGRRRWAFLAVGLLVMMPLYEAFHALAAYGGLAVWWLATLGQAALTRDGWGLVARRSLVVCGVGLGGYLLVQLSLFFPPIVARPTFAVQNSFRESYRDVWFKAVRTPGPWQAWLRTVLHWKRGELPGPPGVGPPPKRPGIPQRIAGTLVYEAGFLLYFFARFVNLAIFGVLALYLAGRRRLGRWSVSRGLIAAVALVGYGVPCVLTWGDFGNAQWWGTPNLYRLTTCAYLLLLVLGMGLLADAFRRWRHGWAWLAVLIVGYQSWALVATACRPATDFHHVPTARLQALAFMRAHVPYGEVVIHPWIDDVIRNAREPQHAVWIYKRHFTLGSNLAGALMYFEGREEQAFVGGYNAPEEVYRASRARRQFYQSPDAACLSEIIDTGRVRWVVADRESPAPPQIVTGWPVVYSNSAVQIYRREAVR